TRLEKEFQDRHAFWTTVRDQHADEPALTKIFDTMLIDSREPADAFYSSLKADFLPAIKSDNADEAAKVFDTTLRPAFTQHRQVIDNVVELVNNHNKAVEASVESTVTTSSWWLFGSILGAVSIVITAGIVVFRLIRVSEVRNKDYAGRFAAINRSQATIEFELDGKIITANENFLNLTGYTLSEIAGRHHSIFVNPVFASSPEYKQLWGSLNAGEPVGGQFERFGKSGKSCWIQATYNPILDSNGKPFKVIKFAFDITEAKRMEFEIAKRQQEDEQNSIDMRRRVNEILTVAERVAKRDYSETLAVRGNDEIGKLGEGLAKFFSDKQAGEIAEQARVDRERAVAAEVERKVEVVLQVVNAVADGKFDVTIPNLGDDAVGQVATALEAAVGAMKNALQEVNNVAGTVSTAAQQLTGVSREISAGAQSQASSLEETASSLEEITSTVKQNTDNAQQARQLANGSRDVAERGGAVVHDAVLAMDEINQSSKRIADIITTIDEIAFQTNLLALNAAVEAARAGEQGRGFAVVAAEVRNLAQRSASAAKEIKTLIQDSVSKVQNGTDLVNKSGQTLGEIVTSVKRVTDIVAEIAAASKEQLVGIEQVNKAVAQMDRVTQANAAQTEEMSGTAGMLLTHSEQLAELVSRFQLSSEQEKPRKRRESPRAGTTKPAEESELRPAPITFSSNVGHEVGVLEF
ncbi:MAG: PAS domain S-box protein, partial [Pirellulaceae bacterium]|nr:PAS domain S-box protein [Pirellulaceae bacterium]